MLRVAYSAPPYHDITAEKNKEVFCHEKNLST